MLYAHFDPDPVPQEWREWHRQEWFSNATFKKLDALLPADVGPEGFHMQDWYWHAELKKYVREPGATYLMDQKLYRYVRPIIKMIAASGREVTEI